MKKRIIINFSIILSLIVLIGCSKSKLTINQNEITLKIGDEYQIEVNYEELEGLNYSSSNDEVATVSKTGLVKANNSGESVIKITTKDGKHSADLKVIVSNEVVINLKLAVGMVQEINIPEGATFDIENKYIANIEDNGMVSAISTGETIIKVLHNDELYQTVNVIVVEKVNRVTLEDVDNFYLDDVVKLKWGIRPLVGYDQFRFEVENEELLSIDNNGLILPLKVGTTNIKIVSLQSDDIYDEIQVTIMQTFIVNSKVNEMKLGNWTFNKDVDLFHTLDEAIEKSNDNTKIIVQNEIVDLETIINKNITLIGENSNIRAHIKLDAEIINISGFIFEEDSLVETTKRVKEINFNNNKAKNISNTFLKFSEYDKLEITNNDMEFIEGIAIELDNINTNSKTIIEDNTFENINSDVISIKTSDRIEDDGYIKIYRNKMNNIKNGLRVDLNNKNTSNKAHLYARFNEFTNYDNAIINVDNNKFEYTFNYWGGKILDSNKFENVSDLKLLGFYEDANEILLKPNYNPENPIIVTLDNEFDEVYLGENISFSYTTLPYTSDPNNVVVSISDKNILELTRDLELIPVRSGMVKLLLRSLNTRQYENYYDIKVTTDPGIHFELDNPTNDITIGTQINIKASPYPFDIADEKVYFKTSNNDIAEVDNDGKVVVKGIGEFIITAYINGDAVVSENLEFESFDFDENNIMDFITKNQLVYSKYHQIFLYGNQVVESNHNENVSRVLLSEYKIYREDDYEENGSDPKTNFPWFVPEDTPGFRPTIPFNTNIPDEFKYNEENVVWVVVHDTGSTTAGMGAYGHARYLYNQFTQDGRQASWHYTIDETEGYQHIPEHEIAYHAGDGSAIPGLDKVSPALGGGNKNGIAIEMSVQSEGHIFQTWQNTAQLVGRLLHKYNLPLSHQKYHQDFSGKLCPQTLIRAEMIPFFESLIENEYIMSSRFASQIKNIEFKSNDSSIMNDNGTIINTPNRTTQVSYTVKVEMNNGENHTRTYKTIVEGKYK